MTRFLQRQNQPDSVRLIRVSGLTSQAATSRAEQIDKDGLVNSGDTFQRPLPGPPVRYPEKEGAASVATKDWLSVACFEIALSSLKEISLKIFQTTTRRTRDESMVGPAPPATHQPSDTYRQLRNRLQTALQALDDLLHLDRLESAEEPKYPVPLPEGKTRVAGGLNGPHVRTDERAWLGRLEQVVTARLDQPDLTVDALADELAMTRRTFYRTLKRLTGCTPAHYVTEARFAQARLLLETGKVSSVKQAAYCVGFRQVSHFARAYQKRFGKNPASYQLR